MTSELYFREELNDLRARTRRQKKRVSKSAVSPTGGEYKTIIVHGLDSAEQGVEHLLQVLASHDLDPHWLYQDECPVTPYVSNTLDGLVRFHGEFSHAAKDIIIDTNDPAVIKQLTEAIEANATVRAYREGEGQKHG